MEIIDIVGIMAAIISTASFVPQALKIISSRKVDGLSAGMYALTAFGFSLWLLFGILKQEWALIVPNAICLVAATFIFFMIIVSKHTRDKVADVITPSL